MSSVSLWFKIGQGKVHHGDTEATETTELGHHVKVNSEGEEELTNAIFQREEIFNEKE